MPTVNLRFVPPDMENLVKLTIFESSDVSGPFVKIEDVTSIGAYPTYIDSYSTSLAVSLTGWFTIQWEDDKGAKSEMSAPVQGGTDSLVWQVVSRVRQRDPSLSEAVIVQEAEAAIQSYFGDTVDPYDPTLEVSYRILNGLVYLSMARSYVTTTVTQGAASSATIGLVSFKSQSGGSSTTVDVQALLDLADQALGVHTSYVMLLEEITVGNSVGRSWLDQSRLVIETEVM